jgi:hypothetical protein
MGRHRMFLITTAGCELDLLQMPEYMAILPLPLGNLDKKKCKTVRNRNQLLVRRIHEHKQRM